MLLPEEENDNRRCDGDGIGGHQPCAMSTSGAGNSGTTDGDGWERIIWVSADGREYLRDIEWYRY